MKPVLFVTNYAPPARVGSFQALAEREGVEFALFGGRVHHGGKGSDPQELGPKGPGTKGSDPTPPWWTRPPNRATSTPSRSARAWKAPTRAGGA